MRGRKEGDSCIQPGARARKLPGTNTADFWRGSSQRPQRRGKLCDSTVLGRRWAFALDGVSGRPLGRVRARRGRHAGGKGGVFLIQGMRMLVLSWLAGRMDTGT